MPGSVGDPVRFAFPYRRLTEVGWPARYHAIEVGIVEEDCTGQADPCSPHVDFEQPGFTYIYMTESNMTLRFSVNSIQKYIPATQSWTLADPDTTELTGVDPEEDFFDTYPNGTASLTYSGGVGGPYRFEPLEGDAILPDIAPPGQPSAEFIGTTGLSWTALARPLTPGGPCHLVGVVFPTGEVAHADAGDEGPVLDPVPVNIAGTLIIRNGWQAYKPIGIYLVPFTKGANPTTHIEAPIRALILFERSKEDDLPEPEE